jgi:hypothetical protein
VSNIHVCDVKKQWWSLRCSAQTHVPR